jgi:RNA polymerase sigma-70 factor (ECF subfamily)
MCELYGGNSRDLKKIYLATSPLLFFIIKSRVKNKESVEDLVQNCYMKLQERGERFSSMKKATGWLAKVAHNMAINYVKSRKNQEKTLDDDIFSELFAAPTSEPWEVPPASILNALPPLFMTSVILRDVAALPYSQISQILKTPESSVRGNLFKAKNYLLEVFFDHEMSLSTT